MKEYEVYHGGQIAVLVRNGENCYIGWTESDRISISDGNVFLTPKQSEYDGEAEIRKDLHGNVVEEKTDKNEVASRFFIFSIAQGLIENSRLLELPKGATVSENSPYVVFSMAENWLQDNTHGCFDDIFTKGLKYIRKGDSILTLCNLRAEGNIYSSFCNDRGRGYANRTHNVYASDNTVYTVNLVEEDNRKNLVTYEYHNKEGISDWVKSYFHTSAGENDFMEDFAKYHDMICYEYRNFQFEGPDKHVFISLIKDNYWTDSNARANFELYRNEYLNLTFLNTVYIRYIITNRKMPKEFFRGRVNFSYILPYMNTAMEFLKQREEVEAKLISKYTALRQNWQIDLTEWKLNNNVHSITEYQAKRFAKWYSESKTDR